MGLKDAVAPKIDWQAKLAEQVARLSDHETARDQRISDAYQIAALIVEEAEKIRDLTPKKDQDLAEISVETIGERADQLAELVAEQR